MHSPLNNGEHTQTDVQFVVGIDEAGRGPLAGPVAVCAVMVSSVAYDTIFNSFEGLHDSKHLTEEKREAFYEQMLVLRKEGALSFSVGLISHTTIDTRGIVYALHSGICTLLQKLGAREENCRVLLDGSLHAPEGYMNQETIVRGDETVPIISVASIAAKVIRDRKMCILAKHYPQYGFECHKGYGTKAHYEALAKYGVSPIHRRSFLGLVKS